MLHLLLLMLLAAPAHAQSEGATRLAEYERLSHEMTSRATKNAWQGVEQSYAAMLETGIPLTAQEHSLGAQAARNMGDVATSRKRFMWALEVEDSLEFRDAIRRIDDTFGPVSLQGDQGKVELTVASMPFDPSQAAAVQFAQAMVAETGSFEGLLPKGDYTFGPMSMKIRPGVHTERIDIRTDKYMRKLERIERKDDGAG